MPASIAHMLIVDEAVKTLSNAENFEIFKDLLNKHKKYVMLGSVGPDLPYYGGMLQGAINLFLDRPGKPKGVDQWSYQLHSKNPNVFPLKMLEITWRDTWDDWDEQDEKKFAFICGFLSHIAADQVIHPIVNKIAGPYYKGGEHRKVHMECEVYQDVILYNHLTGKSLLDATPNEWCDLNPDYGQNTEDWFRYLIQKAFVEAHAVCPTEDEIEAWVDGILMTLRGMNNIGPYVKASRDIEENKEAGEKYGEYFSGVFYQKDCFLKAAQLSATYISAAFMVYVADQWDDKERNNFLGVIQNADLSAPLEGNILLTAQTALEAWQKQRGII